MERNKKTCRACKCICTIVTLIFSVFIGYVIFHVLFPSKPNWKPVVGTFRVGENGLPDNKLEVLEEYALNLTDTQRSALTEFRNIVKTKIVDEHHLKHDVFLVKWLKVADYNIDEADRLLTEHLHWRKDENIKNIHKEDWSDLVGNYYYNLDGVDHLGQPVLFINLGAWDVKAGTKSGKEERFERYIKKMLDEVANLVYKRYETNRKITQYFILIDLNDFGYFRGACFSCMSVYLALANTFEQQYPDLGYQIVTVNTPGVFNIVFSLVKPVLSETTKEHTFLMGDIDEWEPMLMDVMDKDQLPLQLQEQIDAENGNAK